MKAVSIHAEEVAESLALATKMWGHVKKEHGATPEVVGNALIIVLQTYIDGFHEAADKEKVVSHLMKALPLMMLDEDDREATTKH